METIFYALFQSKNSFHDRMQLFNVKKTFKEYMEWQFEKRTEIEKVEGSVVVSNFKIIYNKINQK